MTFSRSAYERALEMGAGVTRESQLNVAYVMSGMAIEIALKAVHASDFQIVRKVHSTSEIYKQMLEDRVQWLTQAVKTLGWKNAELYFAVVDKQLTHPARRYWEPAPEGNRWKSGRVALINRQSKQVVVARDWSPIGMWKVWRMPYMTAQQNLRWACVLLEGQGLNNPYDHRGQLNRAWRKCKKMREEYPQSECTIAGQDVCELLQDGRWTYRTPEVVLHDGSASTREPEGGRAIILQYGGLEYEFLGPADIPDMSLVVGIEPADIVTGTVKIGSIQIRKTGDGEGFRVIDDLRTKRLWFDV